MSWVSWTIAFHSVPLAFCLKWWQWVFYRKRATLMGTSKHWLIIQNWTPDAMVLDHTIQCYLWLLHLRLDQQFPASHLSCWYKHHGPYGPWTQRVEVTQQTNIQLVPHTLGHLCKRFYFFFNLIPLCFKNVLQPFLKLFYCRPGGDIVS